MVLSGDKADDVKESFIELLTILLVWVWLAEEGGNWVLVLDIAGFLIVVDMEAEDGFLHIVSHSMQWIRAIGQCRMNSTEKSL